MAIDIRVMKLALAKMKGLHVRIQMWNGGYKQACAVTTFKSIINNMFIGVTEVSTFSLNLPKNIPHIAFGVYFLFETSFSFQCEINNKLYKINLEMLKINLTNIGLQIQNEIGSRTFPN